MALERDGEVGADAGADPPGHFVKIVIGTRGSALALAQVELTIHALRRAVPDLEIVVKKIRTAGDEGSARPVITDLKAGVKGLFTREIEEQLLAGEIDVAVHSAKDLPGQMCAGLEMCATLERARTEDVLIAKAVRKFSELESGAIIATSSVRRSAQLLAARPELRIEEMRGNVPTRLRKLRDSHSISALVLARAGLDRLGFACETGALKFEGAEFHLESLRAILLPAVGQGAVALQIKSGSAEIAEVLARINHTPTFQCVRAERELLRLLDGDCGMPVGAETNLSGGRLGLRAKVFDPDGTMRSASAEGHADEPELVAAMVFTHLCSEKIS